MTYMIRTIAVDFSCRQEALAESEADVIGLVECAFENFSDVVMVEIESVTGAVLIVDRGQKVSFRSDFS